MIPNEMMLGDYFLVGKDNKRYMFVDSINDSHIMFDYKGNNGYLYESRREYIYPIPITDELLSKLGFERNESLKDYDFDEWDSKDHRISINHLSNSNDRDWSIHIDNEDFETIGKIDFQYLHELQQAVRLITKKELTIKL